MVNKNTDPLYVTRPVLPELDDFVSSLRQIWDQRWLTNNGAFHRQFEKELADFLDVKYVSLFSNGTLALVTALQVLRITGEVITTPYSFVATTHALNWNGIKPVFCDVDPDTLNLSPEKVEALISPSTSAILPVHVYGQPCQVSKLQQIADIHGLRVIYDAAHAFNVRQNGQSIVNSGDLSVLSFHATKIFTTMEGGAIVTNDPKLKQRIDYLKNFGFVDETTVMAPGINGKMNEMQAALGSLQLKQVEKSILQRKKHYMGYFKALDAIDGIDFLPEIDGVEYNYAYLPVFIDGQKFGVSRDRVYEYLRSKNIFARRYFYPLISEFPMYRGLPSAHPDLLPVAYEASRKVLCLPLYPDLTVEDRNRVIANVIAAGNRK